MDNKTKQFKTFLELISRIEPVEFFGLCTLLSVKVVNEESAARSNEEIFTELMDKFLESNREKRRKIIKILKQAAERGKN